MKYSSVTEVIVALFGLITESTTAKMFRSPKSLHAKLLPNEHINFRSTKVSSRKLLVSLSPRQKQSMRAPRLCDRSEGNAMIECRSDHDQRSRFLASWSGNMYIPHF
ncbi:hypothetical protein AA313_de0203088 [Arthrobotrys entomopaga]|nr:hypothetical protein AA313_de0203088 [Arthrobotrys entomopaga]